MKRSRYKEWITVFEWFQQTDRKEIVPKENWNALWELLNGMWQKERQKDATSEELAAHAAAHFHVRAVSTFLLFSSARGCTSS
jgi:hypothetical protein